MNYTAAIRNNLHPQPELFDVFDKESAGSRPPCLGEPRGHRNESSSAPWSSSPDVVPMVQILGTPVPQMGGQMVGVLKLLDSAIPGQVTAVPKISHRPHPRCVRFSLSRRWRSSWWKCRLPRLFRLCSSRLPSRSLTCQVLLLVVIVEVFKVFTQDMVRCSALMSRSLTFQLVWRASRFSPRTGFRSVFLSLACRAVARSFSHFSFGEKARGPPDRSVRSRVRTPAHPR